MLQVFETRNKKISKLVQLGDYLGHSLRENIQLFSIDGGDNKVTYLTESKKVISGNYYIKNNTYILENINIQESDIFTNDERFDEGVKNQVSLFLEGLYNDDYTDAEETFTDVVDILTSRTHYQAISEKLSKKVKIFNSTQNILESEEFSRFAEIIPELVEFLSENREQITKQVPEISNSLKLSESVANAFNVPSLTIKDLNQTKRFEFVDNSKKSIYEMICKQELIKKELLEAKESFDLVWATEPVIDTLASKIFAEESEVREALVNALKELPYLSLLSKKKLSETISRNLGHSSKHISDKDIKAYSSLLFEMKKPAKEQLTSLLSEKYGVNLQYLKDPYSFKSLINTQVVLFEAISRIVPKTSVLKQILSEFSNSLKDKNGIQGVDLNNIIQQIFQHANYSQENIPLMESFSFNKLSNIFEQVDTVLPTLSENVATSEEDKVSVNDKKPETEEGEEEADGEEDETNSGEVQEKEVKDKEPIMSDGEVMKAIKKLSDIVNGVDVPETEDN